VALVDFDTRGSRLASELGLENPATVGALVHTDTLRRYPSSTVRTLARPNWHGVVVIPFGSVEGDSGATADHPATASMLGGLRNTFDWVIVDTPAASDFSDAVRLARHADAVVLTAKAGRTAFDDLRDVCNQLKLAGGHVLGVVFVEDRALGGRRGYLKRNGEAIKDVGLRTGDDTSLPTDAARRR
jgi:Mrp family chromosome partitioning ATPase